MNVTSSYSAANKRIAKNTLYLYLRMGISMLVSLYTSRVVLEALGVVDYGIYGVAGGVVSMFTFINSSMSGATSRFINFAMGKGDKQRMTLTFNMAFYVHLIIAALLLIICETVGLWFLNNRLVIPIERLFAANCVFQLSVLSMLLGITQVPYGASMIAHENMKIYAYVEMVNVIVRLLIVYLLSVFMYDRLIFYAILLFIVTFCVRVFYRLYCMRNYKECRLMVCWDGALLKQMLSFSGWDLYGNMSVMARTQGINMLLNMFFGPAVNAASSIAVHVQGAVAGFAANVSTAVKPQIIKYYAQKNYKEMVDLMSNAVRLNFLILMFVTIPLLIELPYVLSIWLVKVPDYVVSFCSFTLLFNFFGNMSFTLVTGVHATGRIVRPSLINGTLYLMVVPFTFIAFKLGCNPSSPYLFNVLAVIIGMLSNAYTMHIYVDEFSFRRFFFRDFLPCIFVLSVCYSSCYVIRDFLKEGFIRLLFTTILSTAILGLMGYFLLIPRAVSSMMMTKVIKICKKVW